MRAVKSKAKSGKDLYVVQMEGDETLFDHDLEGMCIRCGWFHDEVEPDTRRRTCEECQQPAVYGIEELANMGLVRM